VAAVPSPGCTGFANNFSMDASRAWICGVGSGEFIK
jgi:hypothetical protein